MIDMNTTTKRIVSLIRRTITLFIAHPDDLQIDASEFGRSLRIAITAHRADTPRIIGERGATIQALKGIVEQIVKKNGIGVWLQVREPEVGEREPTKPFEVREDWPKDEVVELVHDILTECLGRTVTRYSKAPKRYQDVAEMVEKLDRDHAADIDLTISPDYDDGFTFIDVDCKCQFMPDEISTVITHLSPLVKAIGMANGRRLHLPAINQHNQC